jgi:Tol biopolymer transport system component
MNRGIFIFLGLIAAIGFAGLYLLQHGSSLFMSGPPTERIAFVSTRGGQTDLWTMATDGTDKRQVTSDAAEDSAPAWSPSGTEIASTSNREDQRFEVYVSAWNGKYVKRLTTGTGTKDLPDWSPDGKEIAFLSSGTVHVLSRFGDDNMQVLPTVEQGATEFARPVLDVKWSPILRTLAAVQDADMGQAALVYEDFGNVERMPVIITAAGRVNVDWSGEGYKLAAAFIDRDDTEGKRSNGIRVMEVSTFDRSDILTVDVDTAGPGGLAWSPDGKQIAFEMWKIVDRRPDTCIGLYVISPDGGKPRLLVSGQATDPVWSPDSKYVVYTLPRDDGRRDIWRIGADGRDAKNLTNGEGDNFQPDWSPSPRKR